MNFLKLKVYNEKTLNKSNIIYEKHIIYSHHNLYSCRSVKMNEDFKTINILLDQNKSTMVENYYINAW